MAELLEGEIAGKCLFSFWPTILSCIPANIYIYIYIF